MGQQAKIPLAQAILDGFLGVTVKVLNSYRSLMFVIAPNLNLADYFHFVLLVSD